jgi:hypothetical protein
MKRNPHIDTLYVTVVMLAVLLLFVSAIVGGLRTQVGELNDRLTVIKQAKTEPLVLDTRTSIIVRWETLDGTQVLPPEVMPLWKYAQSFDDSLALARLKSVIGDDLDTQDPTHFILHTFIDGEEPTR